MTVSELLAALWRPSLLAAAACVAATFAAALAAWHPDATPPLLRSLCANLDLRSEFTLGT